eukprot:gb/GEZN01008991.1/.p1 GENE.gb/GEZN01008991.1/~~gb/GEZN01008991.1/.p1  ORF type:complete len:292 (-),score=-12.96 gb/GEZN01008991.1/:416-1291(-)
MSPYVCLLCVWWLWQCCCHFVLYVKCESGATVSNNLMYGIAFRYLHIPKTGSSFEVMISELFCGKEISTYTRYESIVLHDVDPCPYFRPIESYWPGHAPLPRNHTGVGVLMMVRDPLDRIVSGFFHDLHDCKNMSSKSHLAYYAFTNKSNHEADQALLIEYARCVEQCTTLMLLGYECDHKISLSRELQRRALSVATNASFVGVTNEWSQTVTVWCKRFNRACNESALTRNDRSHRSTYEQILSAKEVLENSWWKPAQSEKLLYELGRSRLHQEQRSCRIDKVDFVAGLST